MVGATFRMLTLTEAGIATSELGKVGWMLGADGNRAYAGTIEFCCGECRVVTEGFKRAVEIEIPTDVDGCVVIVSAIRKVSLPSGKN